jgi:ribosomal protein S27E
VRGDQADITCNECGAVVQTVPVELASALMVEMASGLIYSARCTHCGALNTFPGSSAIEAFICSECGEDVVVTGSVQ